MKYIQLKDGKIAYQGQGEATITTQQLIMAALDNPPEKGFTVSEMRARGRIADQLHEQTKETDLPSSVHFEDADFAVLKKCVLEMRWAVRSAFILDFVDQFD